jgi:hypothetical protein
MILLSKNSLIVGYTISLSAGVAVAYCHDLSNESYCPVDFETSQTMLGSSHVGPACLHSQQSLGHVEFLDVQ